MPEALTNLQKVVQQTATDYWNDSCSIQELTFAIGQGAVGATTNPTIVVNVLKKEMHLWKERIHQMIEEQPTAPETEITWQLIEEMAVRGAQLLEPVFQREKGKKGRLSIQTNPALYRNPQGILDHALHFVTLAPNMQVKLPVTKAGLWAIEEATYQGVSINATVCFTVPQSIAVAEAVERGLNRRTAEGKTISDISPVCTIMVGRLDDWLKIVAKRDGIVLENTEALNWAGIACFKNAHRIYQQKGYRARLLVAAYRHVGHFFELVGGNTVQTVPYEWQLQVNDTPIEIRERLTDPVDPSILESLMCHFPDFVRAYQPDGMGVEEFDTFGATLRTLRGFIASYHELQGVVREFMLPNPDV
ncbi:MAG: transaldolase [Anaerolineae bacterium]|nr:transaldolase [Anaerolineae bacterium]